MLNNPENVTSTMIVLDTMNKNTIFVHAHEVKFSFSDFVEKVSIFDHKYINNTNINMAIAVLLSPKSSLYDLQKPRYGHAVFAPGVKKGRGHPEHMVRVHIVYQGDSGPGTPQLPPCSLKSSGQRNAFSTWVCYSNIKQKSRSTR